MNIYLFDQFFESKYSPNEVREYGLSQFRGKNFINDEHNFYPGIRSKNLDLLDFNLFKYIESKVMKSILNFPEYKESHKNKHEIVIQYHLTSSIHECGFIHKDSEWNQKIFSGVIYLNPNPPKNSGTKFFREKYLYNPKTQSSFYFYKNILFSDIYSFRYLANTTKDKDIILSFNKEKTEHNKKYFDFGHEVPNVYNSAVIYPGHYFHGPDQCFGEKLEDSRLVIVFFVKFID